MKKFNRKNENRITTIDALTEAQKFIFAPMAFQAMAAMIDLGIIKYLDENSSNEADIMSSLNLDEYTVKTLLQVGVANKIIKRDNDKYFLTKIGKLFLYNEMTITNFNYVRDVCYLGASELTDSFKEKKPKGLHKFVGNYSTIYPVLTELPEKMKKSWYGFDHFYSDHCFEEVIQIITDKYTSIIDIGGNTGKFEKLCLDKNNNFDITMLDLDKNIEKIKNNKDLKNCKFYSINVIDKKPEYPEMHNCAIFMSQFLDCFSKREVVKILSDIANKMDNDSSVFILEPFTDMQNFEGAEYSLVHTSLYFTCMANGVSKFYTYKEMEAMIKESGLTIYKCTKDIGTYNYVLLECKKYAMVSN